MSFSIFLFSHFSDTLYFSNIFPFHPCDNTIYLAFLFINPFYCHRFQIILSSSNFPVFLNFTHYSTEEIKSCFSFLIFTEFPITLYFSKLPTIKHSGRRHCRCDGATDIDSASHVVLFTIHHKKQPRVTAENCDVTDENETDVQTWESPCFFAHFQTVASPKHIKVYLHTDIKAHGSRQYINYVSRYTGWGRQVLRTERVCQTQRGGLKSTNLSKTLR